MESAELGVGECKLKDENEVQYPFGRMLIFGGMHSENGTNMPTFMNDVAEVFPHFLNSCI